MLTWDDTKNSNANAFKWYIDDLVILIVVVQQNILKLQMQAIH
ncbi:hypothetical protein BJV85_003460 [Clostridium acetobutylicum]|nr:MULTISPECIES: hypothetical protein [Clostridium]NOV89356.1 hypothetical protein [Clostridium acetobutylicum]NOW16113.1 hypothetical protein [Clostridium acetobutylicum]NRY57793.1 hypothetical protein [Clostridium acetobutylicum]NSA94537.1 hypothetical protein [Clostridium acetobutylicum]NYC95699.1 hypothetical protein [Clostridium acetobutylicum]